MYEVIGHEPVTKDGKIVWRQIRRDLGPTPPQTPQRIEIKTVGSHFAGKSLLTKELDGLRYPEWTGKPGNNGKKDYEE